MSGGRFEYAQYKIADIYNEIEDYLEGHDLDECDVQSYIEDRWLAMFAYKAILNDALEDCGGTPIDFLHCFWTAQRVSESYALYFYGHIAIITSNNVCSRLSVRVVSPLP